MPFDLVLKFRATLVRLATAGLVAMLTGGCQEAPSMAAVVAEAARSVHRYDMFQAAASNGKVLAAATAGSAIVTSVDDGQTWRRHVLPGAASIVALAACPDGSLVGLDFYRKVWVASADGQAWTAHEIKTPDNLMALTCDAGNALWVVGSHSRILSSADKGATWQSRHAGADAILTTVQFLDTQRGHALGEFGTHLATRDGGATWQKQPPLPADFYPYTAVFMDEQRAWASGLAGVILHSSDGGQSWAKQNNPAAVPMYALVALGDSIYGLGFGGQMVALEAGQWLRYDHGKPVPAYLAAGAAHGVDSLLVAGAAGALHVIKPSVRKTEARSQ